jgi:hypothetical protein
MSTAGVRLVSSGAQRRPAARQHKEVLAGCVTMDGFNLSFVFFYFTVKKFAAFIYKQASTRSRPKSTAGMTWLL